MLMLINYNKRLNIVNHLKPLVAVIMVIHIYSVAWKYPNEERKIYYRQNKSHFEKMESLNL